MTAPLRVVFDTNVLVSAALKATGTPRRALDHVLDTGALLVSPATRAELDDVIDRPHLQRYLSAPLKAAFLDRLASSAVVVEPVGRIEACRDPDDDKFLDAAVYGRADYLVSGDEDLLVLGPFRGVPILTPAAFLEAVEATG